MAFTSLFLQDSTFHLVVTIKELGSWLIFPQAHRLGLLIPQVMPG